MAKNRTALASVPAVAVLATNQWWLTWWPDSALPPVVSAVIAGLVALAGQEATERHGEARRLFFISQTFKPAWTRLQRVDANARLNIMLSDGSWIPPFRGLTVAKSFGSEALPKDGKLRLARGAGIAGLALQTEGWVVGLRIDETVAGKPATRSYVLNASGQVESSPGCVVTDIAYGLNQEQRRKTDRLRFILSYPVRRLENGSGDIQAVGKPIGVINIDSTTISPYVVTAPNGELTDLTSTTKEYIDELLPKLAEVAGWVFG